MSKARVDPVALPSESSVVLPCWRGFGAGPPGKPSDGAVLVVVGDEGAGDEATEEHVAAYRFLLEHAERIQQLVLDAIVDAYPAIRARFEKAGLSMRATIDHASLRDLVDLHTVTLHHVHRGGCAYAGYALHCAWDREHGLGVMTHRDRIVRLGGADTAILGWIAERDLDGASTATAPAGRKAAPSAAARPKPSTATSKPKRPRGGRTTR